MGSANSTPAKEGNDIEPDDYTIIVTYNLLVLLF